MPIAVLPVKNMVCHRCVMAVERALTETNIRFQQVTQGEIYLADIISGEQYDKLSLTLSAIGLELIDTKKGTIIEKIKQLVIKKARNEAGMDEQKMKLSIYLAKKLFHEYTYLSSLFSSVEGRTIESYFILQRIEKVKELLVYDELTLLDISVELDYSSTSHLSNQFKQVTGLTPSYFKKLGAIKRNLPGNI